MCETNINLICILINKHTRTRTHTQTHRDLKGEITEDWVNFLDLDAISRDYPLINAPFTSTERRLTRFEGHCCRVGFARIRYIILSSWPYVLRSKNFTDKDDAKLDTICFARNDGIDDTEARYARSAASCLIKLSFALSIGLPLIRKITHKLHCWSLPRMRAITSHGTVRKSWNCISWDSRSTRKGISGLL